MTAAAPTTATAVLRVALIVLAAVGALGLAVFVAFVAWLITSVAREDRRNRRNRPACWWCATSRADTPGGLCQPCTARLAGDDPDGGRPPIRHLRAVPRQPRGVTGPGAP